MSDLDMYAETDPSTPAVTPAPVVIVAAHTPAGVDLTPDTTVEAVTTVDDVEAVTASADDDIGEVRTISTPRRVMRWPSTSVIRFVAIIVVAFVGWHLVINNNPDVPSDPNAAASGEGVFADVSDEPAGNAAVVIAGALDNADAYRAATGTYVGWAAPEGVRVASNADTVIVSAADIAGCQMGASTPQGRGVQDDPTGAACTDAAIGQAQADLDNAIAPQPAATPVGPDIAAVAAAAAKYWSVNTISGGVGFVGLTAELIPEASAVVVAADGTVADIWFAAADGCTHTRLDAAAQVTVVGYDCM